MYHMLNYKMIVSAVLWLFLASQSIAEPRILASIKPIQLIAQAVVGSERQVEVLLPPGATPHHFTMRPSDMRRLNSADMVIWLGKESERYLAKPMARQGENDVMVDLEKFLEIRDDGFRDPHFWLSGRKAIQVAEAIANRLVLLDAQAADDYKKNLAAFSRLVKEQEQVIREALAPFRGSNYLVYHDAYRYFEESYGLAHRAVVALNPEVNPGAKHLLELERIINEQGVNCLLIEPESSSRVVKLLTENSGVRVQMIDPMATGMKVSEQGYVLFLQAVAEKIKHCIH